MQKTKWTFEDKFKNSININLDANSALMKLEVDVSETDWFCLFSKDLIVLKRLLSEVIRELRVRYHSLRQKYTIESKKPSEDYVLFTVSSNKFSVLRFDDMGHWNNKYFFSLREAILFRRHISDILTELVLAKKVVV